MKILFYIFSLLALLDLGSASAWADALWVSSGGGNPVLFQGVKVLRVQEGRIFFRTSSGNEASRELEQITRMNLDDEPALTAAEEAYAAARWDEAADGYQKSLRTASQPWLKDWSAARLVESANQSGRFDAAASGYIALILKDPSLAVKYKPIMPDAKSTYLVSAIGEVNDALARQKLPDEQKQALLNFLLELHRARNDTQAAGQVVERLMEFNATEADNPASASALAELKLNVARLALDKKNYQRALEEIEPNRSIFIEPAQQAEALFCLAEAEYGLVGLRDDPAALEKAALAYMRVVAHFKDAPDSPRVAESLLKTANICERLNDAATAAKLYQQVAAQFPASPAAVKAMENIERLKG